MNKNLIPYSLLFLSLPFITCRKQQSGSSPAAGQAFIKAATQYYTDAIAGQAPLPGLDSTNLRLFTAKTPQWGNAYVISTSIGHAVVVPVAYAKNLHIRANISGRKLFDLNELAKLLLYQDNTRHWHAELVTAYPDSDYLKRGTSFSGLIFVESWTGKRLHQYQYNADGTVLQMAGLVNPSSQPSHVQPSSSITSVTTCIDITGYNYEEDDPDDGVYWEESGGCSTQYVEYDADVSLAPLTATDYGSIGASGVGNGASPATGTIIVSPPTNPIADIATYFGCFTNSSAIDHTYTVTVCVLQPDPGTRSPWGFTSGGSSGSSAASNVVNVGHTFLIMKENSAGTHITRNVGFYPETQVNPAFPTDQGQLDDNESTGYNISLTYTLTNSQFFAMLNYISLGNNSGYIYDLNSNNCTTFALHTLAAGGVTLTTQAGNWSGGTGDDPGDLGEDIRDMTVPANATRSTVGTVHPNQGSCDY
jgi:hypothetical protein